MNSMKLELLAFMSAFFISSQVIAATPTICMDADKCAALGYTKTDNDCPDKNNILRCPFDDRKLYCYTAPPAVVPETPTPEVDTTYYCNVIGSYIDADGNCYKSTDTTSGTAVGVIVSRDGDAVYMNNHHCEEGWELPSADRAIDTYYNTYLSIINASLDARGGDVMKDAPYVALDNESYNPVTRSKFESRGVIVRCYKYKPITRSASNN